MDLSKLSRRERQIMDLLFRLRSATAADVQEQLPDPPSYSAVRAHLRILEEKGYITHVEDGVRYVFSPIVETEQVRGKALKHVVSTFFEGSPQAAFAALLDDTKLNEEELDELARLVEQARTEGR